MLGDRRGMQARLMGERVGADIGGMTVGNAVQALVQRPRDRRETGKAVVVDAGLVAHLQGQRRDQAHQVGIAAALAQAVQRALDLACAGLHGGQRVGDRVLGVVVGMDAEALGRHDRRHPLDDPCDLVRQAAAIGVAQHDPAGPRPVRRLEACLRVAGIGRIAVEKMLGVEHHLRHAARRLREALLDHAQVLVRRDAQRQLDLKRRALADQGDDVGPALEQHREARIVGGAAPGPPGHAERAQPGVGERGRVGEEAVIGRVGARPAAFDVVDAELVEHLGDRHLVGRREVDALGLRAVAQGGIVEIEPLVHRPSAAVPAAGAGTAGRARAPGRRAGR